MTKKDNIEKLAQKIIGDNNLKITTVKDGLNKIATKLKGEPCKYENINSALNCIVEHFDNLPGGGDDDKNKLVGVAYDSPYGNGKYFVDTDNPTMDEIGQDTDYLIAVSIQDNAPILDTDYLTFGVNNSDSGETEVCRKYLKDLKDDNSFIFNAGYDYGGFDLQQYASNKKGVIVIIKKVID